MDLSLFIESPKAQGWHNFPAHLSFHEFQQRLELITGIKACNQMIDTLANEKTIGDQFQNQQHIKVKGAMEFDENVEKYEISKEEYSNLTGTVQHFLKENKMGKYKPTPNPPSINEKTSDFPDIKPGLRCFVEGLNKYGTIQYFGPFHKKIGQVFVGIEYDEPVGKHNGTIDGNFYFKAKSKHGALVRPQIVTLKRSDGSAIPTPEVLFEMELEEM